MLLRKITGIFLLLLLVLASGSAGYMLVEEWTFFDSLYMTVITLASVGYGEVNPLSPNGRIFTMFLILCGSGVLLYSISMITAIVVEGELTDVLKRMKMKKSIESLQGHVIVCGESQTGLYVIEELLKTHRPFVVIESDKEKIASLTQRDIPHVEGDATTDVILLAAGITRASGLITTLHSDAENLFVVLTAKGLNPTLRIISKAVDEESRQKLQKVGADGVVMPNAIGGLRMVSEMVRPGVVSFLDIMLRSMDKTIRVEEIRIGPNSRFSGKTLLETGILTMPDVTVVALAQNGGYRFNPPHDTVVCDGTIIIVMGMVTAINKIL